MSNDVKKISRSKNKLIAGVCGGIAEYFNVDPTLMRIIYCLLAIFTGVIPFTILYLVMWVIIPEQT